MSTRSKSLLCLLVTSAMIGVSGAASAATSMYSIGSLSVKGFGNDTTTGGTYPYTAVVYLGIPLGTFCNEFAGTTTSYPCGGTVPRAQDGSPLTGTGYVSASPTGGSPVQFSLPASHLSQQLGQLPTSFTYGPNGTKHPVNGVPGGSFSYYFPYIYSYSYADLKNAAGNFFGGGGGGSFTFALTEGGTPAGKVTVTGGTNQFGGTMRLLGYYLTNNGYQRSAGLSVVVSSNWLFSIVGGGASPGAPLTASATNYAVNTGVGAVYTGFVKGTAFPWTTGTASVTATRGPFFSVFKRSGYDNRSPGGSGKIQMVSPMLTHWTCPACGSDYETGGIGILNLEFVPEPANAMMLVAGISLLGLVYRASHRRA